MQSFKEFLHIKSRHIQSFMTEGWTDGRRDGMMNRTKTEMGYIMKQQV